MILPSPLALTALGTTLIVGAGLIFWFIKPMIKIALVMGLVGGFLLACAGVAYGYEEMGKAKIQPQLDAALSRIANDEARAESFRQDAVVAANNAADVVRKKNDELKKLKDKLQGRIDALEKQVTAAPVGAAAGQLLDHVIAENNSASFGPGADAEALAAAASAVDTTVAQWIQWGGEVANLYGKCATQVLGLQDYVGKITAAANATAAQH